MLKKLTNTEELSTNTLQCKFCRFRIDKDKEDWEVVDQKNYHSNCYEYGVKKST